MIQQISFNLQASDIKFILFSSLQEFAFEKNMRLSNYHKNASGHVDKFQQYWREYNMLLLSIAAIFDPRHKFEFVEFLSNEVYGEFSDQHIKEVHDYF